MGFASECEQLSPTGFVDVCQREAGPAVRSPELSQFEKWLSPELEQALEEMDVVAQFLVVRHFDALKPSKPDTPARWEALVRGYAGMDC